MEIDDIKGKNLVNNKCRHGNNKDALSMWRPLIIGELNNIGMLY